MKRSLDSSFVGFIFCLIGLISCSGSLPDGTSGATKKSARANSNGMQEPAKLESLDSSSVGSEKTKPNQSDKCSPSAEIPSYIPKDSDAEELHEYGKQRILQKDGETAVAILAKASGMEPENPAILGDFASALLQCKLYDQAIQNAKKAAALDPNNVDLAANLAQTYQIAGRLGEAALHYRKAIEIKSDDPAIHNNLAVLLALSDLKAAEEEVRVAIGLVAKSEYLVNLGAILFRQNRLIEAEVVLRRAIKADEKNEFAHNYLGVILLGQKRTKEAAESFRKALALNPDYAVARENLCAIEEDFDFKGPWNNE